MSAPKSTRSTAGFRSLQLFEKDTNGYPVGAKTLEACNPFQVTSDAFTATLTPVAAQTTVAGTVPYYGIEFAGTKVLTINDPAPRVIPHVGNDRVLAKQVLPPTEALNGELHIDKKYDILDALVSGTLLQTIGEALVTGIATSKRGFEPSLAALAYSYAVDDDLASPNYGADEWDGRIFPRVNIFLRETGYGAEANERLYSLTPMICTTHIWGIQFSLANEGFVTAEMIPILTQGKPTIVSWIGNGTVKAFPFDGNKPAKATTKVDIVTKNGVLAAPTTDYVAYTSGVIFTTPPAANAVVTCFYEAA
jgi:hypothetical protein